MATRPSRRDEFETAVGCALHLEYDAAALALDGFWDDDGDTYGRAAGDTNTYCIGRIGRHNVVLALLPNMGKISAVSAAASLRSSLTGLRLAVVAGTGDVIISKTVVQYDYGRQHQDRFIRRDTLDDNLGRPNRDIRSLMSTLDTDRRRDGLERGAAQAMDQIREKAAQARRRGRYVRPSASEDRLFKPDYQHQHRNQSNCGCFKQVREAARGPHRATRCRASSSRVSCDYADSHKSKKWQTYGEACGGRAADERRDDQHNL
ncbi:hypothetical protein LX36DRAFT_500426 [Colletotrichum falcatum]|nr:hypothetical protein LX36DRAFT_500426 [Colletotrichum falcatum]